MEEVLQNGRRRQRSDKAVVEQAVKSPWVHSGRHGQMTLDVQPVNWRLVRCSGEVEYQTASNFLIQ